MALAQIPVKIEEIREWLPETYKMFIDDLRNSKSKSANKPEEKIHWMLSWGFFGKKSKDDEAYLQKLKDKTTLTFTERLNADLPKIKITVFMKAGEHYLRVDRAIDPTPQFIIDFTTDVLKIQMLKEQEEVNNPEVRESLREFEYLLDELQEVDGEGKPVAKKALRMDDVLDKIGEFGIGSLTIKEKEFLDKMSRA